MTVYNLYHPPNPSDAAMTLDTAEPIDALIARCLQREQTAYAALYERYTQGLYRLCYSLVLNRQDAEDVAQESFVYAFKNLHHFDAAKASFKTWLYTIAVSRCRNTYRRKRPMLLDFSQLFGLEMRDTETLNPEQAVSRRAAQDAVEAALVQLSPTLREAVVLRYGHALTYREIAEVMHCPQKTAESRVRLAHDRLRSLLTPVGRGLLEELFSF
ncbi:MAG: sigma-70 family RNA polymerase sigma factor [Armatimonadetes bacterium]|nr:sigma-70 family RNA polymerase sigma factor [Anaerolineae bacterium]